MNFITIIFIVCSVVASITGFVLIGCLSLNFLKELENETNPRNKENT